jgi:hypothetical protein
MKIFLFYPEQLIIFGIGSGIISGNIDQNIERFIDENELETRLNQLSIENIKVYDSELSSTQPNNQINLKQEIELIHGKINTLSSVISGNVDQDIERFIDENELETRLDEISIKDIDVNVYLLIEKLNNLNQETK